MQRIVVGMSGGVDSSLTAVLLQEQGFEVVGVTMQLWPCGLGGGEDPEDACCSPTDARAVAGRFGIAHYMVDFQDRFRTQVVDDFLYAYTHGETPNPCIGCNQTVKFGDLATWARQLGATAVGTGHYARVAEVNGRLCPAVPSDTSKDQTYFLFSLAQDQLAAAQFPLGDYTKDAVRTLAAERGLPNARKEESMDLCFVGPDGVTGFLRQEAPQAFAPGPVELQDGTVIGEHRGLPGVTIGQRKGLGVAWREPLYVVHLDVARNAIVMGPRDALLIQETWLRDCLWHLHDELPVEGVRCLMRNRHRGPPVPATVLPAELPGGGFGARVVYEQPCSRPAPGQAGVAYDPELQLCLGGGWFVAQG
ncbi:MAG: tRNA 2-thiouridine(34) synthase MnmA [Planctomycetota bacterium]|jgi:tRNA-specific 2-thiouridylase|nr:tRNA 2-thiouridine(34) synthase MnmA [Planctomycetota bacterium]